MKRLIYNTATAMLVLTAMCVSSCSYHPKGAITVNPQAVVLTPDINNDIDFDVTLNVPQDYISSRSMAKIEPMLVLGDKVAQTFDPVIVQGKIYGKKAKRLERLYGIAPDPQAHQMGAANGRPLTVPLRETIHISDNFDSGRILAVVTTDGCGECYGTDTIPLAYLSNLSNLIDTESMLVQWIDTVLPPVEKTFKGEGEARLQFEVNKFDILPGLANNAAEMDSMLRALTPVFKDPLATLNRMSVFGSASAEGKYDKNVILAENRANAAVDWLKDKLNLTQRQRNMIKIGSKPEGWWPVIASMHAAGDPDSILVKEIVEQYPDLKTGEAEKRIRKLPCWPNIAANHLAKDRRVIYNYEWTIKSFDTDEEVVEMFRTRPDALSIPEYLRVAHIVENTTEGDDELIKVYETMLKYYGTNEVGINNLAALYFENARYRDAIKLLEKQPNLTPDMINTMAVCYKELGFVDKAIELLMSTDTENSRYNVGSLLASTHRMAEAYPYLQGSGELNAAITALGVNKNQDAWLILSLLQDDSPKADYVRAIALARLGDNAKSLQYLGRAVKDTKLKARAANEADFMPLHNEPEYNRLINN